MKLPICLHTGLACVAIWLGGCQLNDDGSAPPAPPGKAPDAAQSASNTHTGTAAQPPKHDAGAPLDAGAAGDGGEPSDAELDADAFIPPSLFLDAALLFDASLSPPMVDAAEAPFDAGF